MRIVADTDVCVGAGQCVLADPTVFDQNEDDGTSRFPGVLVDITDRKAAEAAVGSSALGNPASARPDAGRPAAEASMAGSSATGPSK